MTASVNPNIPSTPCAAAPSVGETMTATAAGTVSSSSFPACTDAKLKTCQFGQKFPFYYSVNF